MRVLVLCHGNVNRSALAAAMIRRARPKWLVVDAGLKTKNGRPATPKAKRAAAERGLDLLQHRSTVVEEYAPYNMFDVILYMDGGNEKRLEAIVHPSTWVKRCRLLASYGSLRRIPDPNYTSDPDELRDIWQKLEMCVDKFLEAHPA